MFIYCSTGPGHDFRFLVRSKNFSRKEKKKLGSVGHRCFPSVFYSDIITCARRPNISGVKNDGAVRARTSVRSFCAIVALSISMWDKNKKKIINLNKKLPVRLYAGPSRVGEKTKTWRSHIVASKAILNPNRNRLTALTRRISYSRREPAWEYHKPKIMYKNKNNFEVLRLLYSHYDLMSDCE